MVEAKGSQKLQGCIIFFYVLSFNFKFFQALRNAPKTAKALTLANVAGAFLVLILGMGLSTVTAFIEFLWTSRKIFSNENVSIMKYQLNSQTVNEFLV